MVVSLCLFSPDQPDSAHYWQWDWAEAKQVRLLAPWESLWMWESSGSCCVHTTAYRSFLLFYWSIVDLQYCMSFICTANNDSLFSWIILQLKLLQVSGYNSLCCTIYPCCSFILYIVDGTSQSHTPFLSITPSLSPLVSICLFSRSVSLFET